MRFSNQTKNIDTSKYIIKKLHLNNIQAQYNPDRFRFWKSLHAGQDNEVLNMLYSPHYEFLKKYKINKHIGEDNNTRYYKLQKLYGRNYRQIKNKILEFIKLFEDIKQNGCKKEIIILSKPIVKNKYNKGFEIFEGHHRITCLLILKYKLINAKVIIND